MHQVLPRCKGNTLFPGVCFQRGKGWNDQGTDILSPVADYFDLFNVVIPPYERFDTLGSDVLPPRRYDEVLDPVGNFDKSVLIDNSNVSRFQPPVNDRCRRILRFVVIPLHDVRTSSQDFSVLSDLHLTQRHRPAHGTEFKCAGTIVRNHGGRFRQSVALTDEKPRSEEKFLDIL